MSFRRDTLWTAVDAIVAAGLAFLFRLFVARVLMPDDFGLAAMALAVIALLQVVIDLGFNAALIQKDEHLLTPRMIDTTFTASLILSLSVAALTAFVVAPLAADYYSQPAVTPLIAGAALMLLPSPFTSVASAMMMRARRFKALAIIRCTTVIGSIGAAALLLWAMPGPWVVVGQAIVASLVNSLGLQIAVRRRYRLVLHREDLHSILRFSGFILASGIAVSVSASAGVFIIGRLASAGDVALFSLATYLIDTTRVVLSSIFSRVTYVHYSQAKHDMDRLRELYLSSLRWSCRLIFPACVVIALFGPALSVAFLGPEWAGMARVLGWLSLAAMIVAADGSSSSLFQATGRPGLEFGIFVATSGVLQIAFMLLGIRIGGLEGLAIALVVAKAVAVAVRQAALSRLLTSYKRTAFGIVLDAVLRQAPFLLAWLVARNLVEPAWTTDLASVAAALVIYAAISMPADLYAHADRWRSRMALRWARR